ncbi:MAG TPA: pyridoxamine 5'-phosphate oxidase family protein [Thermodesulfobacteriota bacterium]|nr:pyridoxamine 5'-phosphate oxidase family protein [Thermodesulfobacteriota bacterium]
MGSDDNQTKDFISRALDAARFAVLATENSGQPHASLVAITAMAGIREVVFATYRDTRKYRNLTENGRVAVFIEGKGEPDARLPGRFVVTGVGEAEEIGEPEKAAPLRLHAGRHPDLESFLRSAKCALFRVTISAYQVVRGVDDVTWIHLH